jgi:hypothetical protein
VVYTDSRRSWLVRKFGMQPTRLPPMVFDVAIGLGIGTSKDGKGANSRSAANAFRCKELLDTRKVKNIMFVGGAHKPGGVVEAVGMWKAIGSPPGVVLETTSKTTETNALRSLEILKACSWKTAILCVETVHAKRRMRPTFEEVWYAPGEDPRLYFAIEPTFGLYDDAPDFLESPLGHVLEKPLGFVLFDLGATYGLPLIKNNPLMKNRAKRFFNRAE